MNKHGHYGVAMLLYSPILFIFISQGSTLIGLLGFFIVFSLSRVPDFDFYIPFITHRGITHTIWFALLVGFLLSVPFESTGSVMLFDKNISHQMLAFIMGSYPIIAHLIGDSLTPSGVRPFMPLSMKRYSMNFAASGNPLWNSLFLLIGVFSIVIALIAGGPLTLPDISEPISIFDHFN